MKRIAAILVFLLMLAVLSAAAGEVSVTFSPEQPRVGDYVDVTVTPEREGFKSITWSMTVDGEKSIAYKNPDKKKGADQHLAASFRPRKEGSYILKVTVSYGAKDKETAEVTIPVSGSAPMPQKSSSVLLAATCGSSINRRRSTPSLSERSLCDMAPSKCRISRRRRAFCSVVVVDGMADLFCCLGAL